MAKSDFSFHHDFRVRYSEVDAQAIVFFANYLTYFDSAHNEYMRKLGFNYQEHVKATDTDFHILKVQVEYHAPAKFDDELEVYVRTSRIGRSSMDAYFEIYLKNTEQLITSATSTLVNTDQTSMKSAPLPDSFVEKICTLETTPVIRS